MSSTEKTKGQVDCDVKKITFRDDSHVNINIFKNGKDVSSGPVFLVLPALGVRAGFYQPLVFSMVTKGWHVVTMDWRGTGTSSVQVSRKAGFGFHELLTIDLPGIVTEVKRLFPNSPAYLLGHSLGGQLALLYASLIEQTFEGVVVLTGGSNYYKNLKLFYRTIRLFNYRLIQIVTMICGYFPGHRLGFAGKESKIMMKDWLQESLTGVYNVSNNDKDFERLLGLIEIPVFFITLFGDKYVTSKCAKKLSQKLSNAEITKIELDAADYNLPRFDHFNWRKTPDPIAEQIEKWLPQH